MKVRLELVERKRVQDGGISMGVRGAQAWAGLRSYRKGSPSLQSCGKDGQREVHRCNAIHRACLEELIIDWLGLIEMWWGKGEWSASPEVRRAWKRQEKIIESGGHLLMIPEMGGSDCWVWQIQKYRAFYGPVGEDRGNGPDNKSPGADHWME